MLTLDQDLFALLPTDVRIIHVCSDLTITLIDDEGNIVQDNWSIENRGLYQADTFITKEATVEAPGLSLKRMIEWQDECERYYRAAEKIAENPDASIKDLRYWLDQKMDKNCLMDVSGIEPDEGDNIPDFNLKALTGLQSSKDKRVRAGGLQSLNIRN